MLIGAQIRRGRVSLAITEVEAYAGPEDSASHARFGKTPRNEVMWGRAGRLYVYLCYGVHNLVNVSTGRVGEASAVLLRAAEVVGGEALVRRRRGGRPHSPDLCSGPGKLGQALGLHAGASGVDLCAEGGVELWLASPRAPLLCGPRVGIDFADLADRTRPWRFADANSRAVSQRRGLRPAL
jgi:DNA-3-methyladenine glycosylase